jgi:hypothetical protein
MELFKHNNLGKSLGIDQSEDIISVPKLICGIEGIDLDFAICDVFSDEFKELNSFDHALLLSVFGTGTEIELDRALTVIKTKATKSIFVEPTNHKKFSEETVLSFWTERFSKYGEIKLLGFTDYQNRGLFQIIL